MYAMQYGKESRKYTHAPTHTLARLLNCGKPPCNMKYKSDFGVIQITLGNC